MRHTLRRYYGAGDLHFITCSCYQRQPLLGTPRRRDLFLTVLEQVRRRYQFVVAGYLRTRIIDSFPASLRWTSGRMGFARSIEFVGFRPERYRGWPLLMSCPRNCPGNWGKGASLMT